MEYTTWHFRVIPLPKELFPTFAMTFPEGWKPIGAYGPPDDPRSFQVVIAYEAAEGQHPPDPFTMSPNKSQKGGG